MLGELKANLSATIADLQNFNQSSFTASSVVDEKNLFQSRTDFTSVTVQKIAFEYLKVASLFMSIVETVGYYDSLFSMHFTSELTYLSSNASQHLEAEYLGLFSHLICFIFMTVPKVYPH